MSGCLLRLCRVCGLAWVAVLLLVAPVVVLAVQATGANTELSTLARLLTVEDEVTRWGFASVVLDELLSAYEVELEASFNAPTRRAGRQRRLRNWQRGTDAYIAMLYRMRTRLDDGDPFELFVDAQGQIVIVIGDEVVLVGGPRHDLVKQIEAKIVRQFCLYNDCGWLGLHAADERPRTFSSLGRGEWSRLQGGRLRYRVDNHVVFEFDTVTDRDYIAAQADQVVDELGLLAEQFDQARRLSIPIEWRAIAEDLVGIRNHGNVVLNADRDYFELSLPLLARLSVADWQRVVAWIEQGALGVLTFPRADSLF